MYKEIVIVFHHIKIKMIAKYSIAHVTYFKLKAKMICYFTNNVY